MKAYVKAAIVAVICGIGFILFLKSGLTWAATLSATIAVLAGSAAITEWETRKR